MDNQLNLISKIIIVHIEDLCDFIVLTKNSIASLTYIM